MHKENQSVSTNSVIRMGQLCSSPKRQGKLPCSAATIWRWVKIGQFPAPYKIGLNTTVFSLSEIDQWLEAQRVAQK